MGSDTYSGADGLLAGRSNAGLTDPGQKAAHTLTQIAVLVCSTPKLDDLVAGNIMQMLRGRSLTRSGRLTSACVEMTKPLERPRANSDAADLPEER